MLRDDRARREFLPPLSEAEVAAIEMILPPVVADAHDWLSRFPEIGAGPVLPTSIIKIAQLSKLAVRDIATAVKWELWALSLDDLFDRRDGPVPGAREMADECFRIATATPGRETSSTAFGAAFLEVKTALATHSVFTQLQSAFVWGLSGLLDGILYGSERGTGPLPPFDEYLYHTAHSFWHPFIWTLPLFDDPAVIGQLGALMELANQCGRACRLSNDISTLPREKLEGVLNSLSIRASELARVQKRHRLTPRFRSEAQIQIAELMERERHKARQMAGGIFTESRAELAFVRLMDLAIETYLRRDVREWARTLNWVDGKVSEDRGASW
jgi:hypothetical protein